MSSGDSKQSKDSNEDLTPSKTTRMAKSVAESPPSIGDSPGDEFKRTSAKQWGILKLRPYEDADTQDWWFASIACPLLAATAGPLANVLSIGALVTYWRAEIQPGSEYLELDAQPYKDPQWCYNINVASLVFGSVGNMFLLANFTNRIRYIVALPVTIIFWFVATGMLIGIQCAMAVYDPPGDNDVYTQGFWYGVIAAVLYGFCAFVLLINMTGYFLGHYPQHFNLTDAQRTLILQTMLFFVWLAGGAGIFSALQTRYSPDPADHWLFTDALYFCDVTILTVGFGDLYPTNDKARGFVMPYAVIGIIMLGLMISSMSSFAKDIGKENIMKKQVENRRARTVERSTGHSEDFELKGVVNMSRRRSANRSNSRGPSFDASRRRSSAISRKAAQWREMHESTLTAREPEPEQEEQDEGEDGEEAEEQVKDRLPPSQLAPPIEDQALSYFEPRKPMRPGLTSTGPSARRQTLIRNASFLLAPIGLAKRPPARKSRALILREEKDRFMAMRRIQEELNRWKGWTSLTISVIAFAIVWFCGAAVFYATEHSTQQLTYFQALYFCYVSLLTIGYGDLSPKSNAGRPFFVVWSLIAVPTVTLLVSDASTTVVQGFKDGTNKLADFTVLPKYGTWRSFVRRHERWLGWADIEKQRERRAAKRRIERGFEAGPAEESWVRFAEEGREAAESGGGNGGDRTPPLLERRLAREEEKKPTDWERGRKLSAAIKRAAREATLAPHKKYSFEEWVEFTELIRFTSAKRRSMRRKNARERARAVSRGRPWDEKKAAAGGRGGGGGGGGGGDAYDSSGGEQDEEEEGEDEDGEHMIEWDWIGENSPMMQDQSEPEFVLQRLCESMNRFMRMQSRLYDAG